MKRFIFITTFMILSALLFANVDATFGDIRIVVEDYSGTVTIYRKSTNDRYISMFDSKTFTKTPSFYVEYDGAVLPVNVSGGFKVSSSYKDTRVTLTAVLKNKLEVIVNYDFFAARGEIIDSVKVSSILRNLSDTENEVAVKAFFDTWLGENTLTHFTTATTGSIISETSFTDMQEDKWIQSANTTDAIRFIIPNHRINSIDSITAANKNLLSQLNWYYDIQRGREFHSLNSYNNSALTITWKKTFLAKSPRTDIEFYIFTGNVGDVLPEVWPLNSSELTSYDTESINSLSFLSQEDLERILRILDTINELKADNNYLSEQEIVLLNAEVDMILENARR